VKQLLDFATKWSQAAAPAKRGTRGAVDVLATQLTSLHLKPAPTAEPALRALEAARAVAAHMIAELADVTLRLIEALVVEPAAAAARQEQQRKQETARRSLMRRRNRAPVRTGYEREVATVVLVDDDDDDDDDDDGSELDWEEECLAPPAFKRHCLEWAISHATGGKNTPPHVAGGLDYLLRALLDVHRIPLPSASDPLLLRWFETEEPDAPLGLLARPAPPRRVRMAAAEAALLGLLSTRQHEVRRRDPATHTAHAHLARAPHTRAAHAHRTRAPHTRTARAHRTRTHLHMAPITLPPPPSPPSHRLCG